MKALIKQLAKFASVGAIATGLHVLVALALHHGLGLAPLRANLGAFCMATLWSYFGNWAWTFGAQAKVKSSAPKFIAMSLAGFGLNQSIVYWVTVVEKLPFAVALVPVVMIVPAFTFWVSRTHIFTAAKTA
ncbi:MAG: GtrA family protein [Alphaproteobacteria bacterium]|nr:GtrA family protein [Alphaproteobacteria bacterium]